MQRLCVFCGSRPGIRPTYVRAAERVGRELAERGIGLVYGGGRVGLMGTVADAALAAKGYVIGVIPQSLVEKEVAHRHLSDLRVVRSMHERKAMMAELSDGFLALPGGFGTFEEWFEVVTWSQLGLHTKPSALLNIDGYYDPLLRLIDHGVKEGFIGEAHRDMIVSDKSVSRVLDKLDAWKRPALVEKWINRSQS
jgi:uncharacterized protein (TIGR00730 family)